ncbi:MAG TPA: phosphoribosylformylglycinamidine cyclo-ligase [Terriglobales bacterium]|nr:phosphoribosylformylglycinamidine cyclo-ligase [Terriglobales bacterium]
MENSAYKKAGVDVTAGYRAVDLIKPYAAKTAIPGVLRGLGGFGAAFELDLSRFSHPVLISGTDGVGTKLKLAFAMDKHDTIGIDCVAMCVNDIVCSGAAPLFFLDYIAMGKNEPLRTAAVVKGVADGCLEAGCALVGGEMAEMPGFYPEDEYDLAGFAVGAVNKADLVDGSAVAEGDIIVGMPSSGVHSNGFSLVRRIIADRGLDIEKTYDGLPAPLGEVLLTPTAIYVKPVLELHKKIKPHGFAHVTGGGFYENLPRAFGPGLSAVVDKSAVPALPIFSFLAKAGAIPEDEMYGTFNMGVGMAVYLAPQDVEVAFETLPGAFILGKVEAGGRPVVIR